MYYKVVYIKLITDISWFTYKIIDRIHKNWQDFTFICRSTHISLDSHKEIWTKEIFYYNSAYEKCVQLYLQNIYILGAYLLVTNFQYALSHIVMCLISGLGSVMKRFPCSYINLYVSFSVIQYCNVHPVLPY